jgi:hypothetical protein
LIIIVSLICLWNPYYLCPSFQVTVFFGVSFFWTKFFINLEQIAVMANHYLPIEQLNFYLSQIKEVKLVVEGVEK